MAKEEEGGEELTQYLQSPQIYLQAGSSNGEDGSVSGVHLRWTFNNYLGENHLPKGDFAGTNYLFNKSKDVVKIYRSVFNEEYKLCVDLSSLTITYFPQTNFEEPYTIVSDYEFAISGTSYVLELKFINQHLLDQLFMTVFVSNNTVSVTDILEYYTGEVQIGIQDQLFFRSIIDIQDNGANKLSVAGSHTDILRIESISKLDVENPSDLNLSNRKVVNEFQELILEADNMSYLRFKSGTHYPTTFCFYVYEDYFSRANEWTPIGDYSIESEDDELVYNRLSNTDADIVIDGSWPKYYGSNAGNGLRKVNENNYRDRWGSGSLEDIKTLVQDYISLSDSDSRALKLFDDDGASTGSMQFSLLDIINIQATDFHIARMLGLGTIDKIELEGRFMYLMEYETLETVNGYDSLSKPTKHLWMTHSIGAENTMIPLNPILDEINYGEDAFNATSTNTTNSLTDPNGYSYFGNFRIVNINRKLYDFEAKTLPNFFHSNLQFSLALSALPMSYGIEYKASTETAFRIPGVMADDELFDSGGNKEVYTILNNQQPRLFAHKEQEVGKHKYAAYTVNWFSRHSTLSDVKETDKTIFSNIEVPSPPSGLRVHLIQDEDFLMFTTSAEQTRLNSISGDKTLLRCLFDYNYQQFGNYQTPNLIKFKFKDTPLLTAEGVISQIQDLSANSVLIESDAIEFKSKNPVEFIYPTVIQADIAKYIGGTLFSNGKQFKIINITNAGDKPNITIQKIIETHIIDPGNNNINQTVPFEVLPEEDARFTIVENNQLSSNWGNDFEKTVYIEPFFSLSTVYIKIGNLSRKFSVKQIIAGSNDKLILREKFDADYTSFELSFWWRIFTSSITNNGGTTTIELIGDLTSQIATSDLIVLHGVSDAQGSFVVAAISFNGTNTVIVINHSFGTAINNCYLFYKWSSNLNSTNSIDNSFTLNGKLPSGAKLPHAETKQNLDGESIETIYGGIFEPANIVAIAGNTDVYQVNFTNYNLEDPIDSDVSWYLGSIRFFYNNEEQILDVINIDNTGSNLSIIAYAPNFNAGMLPLNGINVNFFPSYKVYLQSDNPAGFNEASTIPQNQNLTRETLFTAYATDTMNGVASKLATPSLVNAKLISEPQPPQKPTGPTIANRPDSKGKSSYSIELSIDITAHKPYSFIFYRSNHLALLNQLYRPETIILILEEIESYRLSDDIYWFNDVWIGLVSVITELGNFRNYPVGDNFYQLPLPDNNLYSIEDELGNLFFPFETANFNLNSNFSVGGVQISYQDIVKEAIEEAFVPITAQPLVYDQIKLDTVGPPSNTAPVYEDESGNLLSFSDSRFNPSPMAVRKGNNHVVFVDYTLDGASQNLWFYFAREMNANLKMSGASPIQGPIRVPNTFAATAPIIKRTLINTDPSDPKVSIEIEPYSSGDRIVDFQLFRAKVGLQPPFAESDFEKLPIVELQDGKVFDDFSDLTEIPFSEPLYYRVFALRTIVDESSIIKKSYSIGSNIVMTTIPNMNNPIAPALTINFTTSQNAPKVIDSMEFIWNKTTYKGSYYLYKMSNNGTWNKIFEIKNTNEASFSIAKDATDLLDVDLLKEDADGNELFYRFKVDVENTDGLLNLEEKVVII